VHGVHIWRASLERPTEDVGELHELLDPPERARAAAFRNERDRRRFVVARATLRMLLGEYTETAPHRVALRVLPGGKPALAPGTGTPELHFNVAHSAALALFAFADRDVGIDVEHVAHNNDMARVVAHFFSPDEAFAFRQLGESDRARFFFRTWVRKEAYVKATGKGFAIDPARVSVSNPLASGVTLHDDDGMGRVDAGYSVHDLADIDDHVAAVAVTACGGAPAIRYREWAFESKA
jgi:4'-phosphopantetheinyl transferase